MNKKFSTLVTALLLSGALGTVNAETVEVSSLKELKKYLSEGGVLTGLNGGDELVIKKGNYDIPFYSRVANDGKGGGEYIIVNTPNIVIRGEGDPKISGRLVLTADNITVSGLTIINEGLQDGEKGIDASRFYNKSAISVLADEVTITGNTFVAETPEKDQCIQGIELIPTTKDVDYTITGNTFKGFDKVVDGTEGVIYPSYAISLDQSYKLDGFALAHIPDIIKEKTFTSATKVNFDASVLFTAESGNTFEGCAFNYATIEDPDAVNTAGADVYEYAQVEPLKGKDGKILNAECIQALVNNAKDDATILFDGSVEDFEKAVGDAELEGDVAVQCTDANVLYGDVENPDNGKSGIVGDAAEELEPTVLGSELLAKNDGLYNMLVFKANGKNYAIYADKETKAIRATEVTKGADFAKNSAYLWKMKESKDPQGKIYYSFTNQDEVLLVFSADKADANKKKGMFYPENGIAYNNGVTFKLHENVFGETLGIKAGKYNFGLYGAANITLHVEDLNWYEKDGFSVTIKYGDKLDKTDIAGNVFTGHLTPMSRTDITKPAADVDTKFYLKNADGEYIVAQKYATNGNDPAQATYTFTTVSEEELSEDIAHEGGKYYGLFVAKVSASNTDLQKLKTIDILQVKLPAGWSTIGRLDVGEDEVPTLAASYKTALKPIQIAMGGDDLVQPKDLLKKGKFYTVELIASTDEDVKTGKLAVAGDRYNDEIDFVSSYGNVLEGQWALTVKDNGTGDYLFTNRESGDTWTLSRTLYYTDEENEYRSGDNTYRIEVVPEHAATDGYTTLSDVKNTKFNLGFSSEVFEGNAWFTENHAGVENHTIGLNSDIDEALEFTATEYAAARSEKHNANHTYTYTPSDSIYVISMLGYYDAQGYKTTKDTLKVISYSFVNQYTEPLVYNAEDDKYESKVYKNATAKTRYASVEEAAADADKFALRLDDNKLDGSKLNLRVVDFERKAVENVKENSVSASEMYQIFAGNPMKVYAGDVKDGILNQTDLYSRPENDLFVVQETERPMYRPVVNALDTISLYRNDNPMSVLFEDKGFLGMENLAQYPEIAPAMVADTAYVRNETYRPQYMLVVNPDIHPAGKWCDVCGTDDCEHAVPTAGWVEGRYLVNLVDTAYAWDEANKHKDGNPYINTEKYYRLGFVQATHRNDSLIIDGTKDTLFVGGEDYNQAKFAFRYDNLDDESFRIETANYKKLDDADEVTRDGEGWLKWMNGVVVVVDDIEDADIFNMNEEETGKPTDNYEITTSEVKVIAGDGQITIAGAAGKKVVVSNILGQVVANTVITSDNATIAAPQGIVVVAVEGEEAVKAIVK